jgi:hypothetical protein
VRYLGQLIDERVLLADVWCGREQLAVVGAQLAPASRDRD